MIYCNIYIFHSYQMQKESRELEIGGGIETLQDYRTVKLGYDTLKSLRELSWVQLVEFYGISTFVGYLMPNPPLYK